MESISTIGPSEISRIAREQKQEMCMAMIENPIDLLVKVSLSSESMVNEVPIESENSPIESTGLESSSDVSPKFSFSSIFFTQAIIHVLEELPM